MQKLLTQNSVWGWEIFCGLEISSVAHSKMRTMRQFVTLNLLAFLSLLSNFLFRKHETSSLVCLVGKLTAVKKDNFDTMGENKTSHIN